MIGDLGTLLVKTCGLGVIAGLFRLLGMDSRGTGDDDCHPLQGYGLASLALASAITTLRNIVNKNHRSDAMCKCTFGRNGTDERVTPAHVRRYNHSPTRAGAGYSFNRCTSLVDSVGQGAPVHGRMRYRYSSTEPNKEDVTRPQTPTPQHERRTRSQGCGKIFFGRIRRPIPVYAGYLPLARRVKGYLLRSTVLA